MTGVDQQARADAYHRNLVAMLFGARCEAGGAKGLDESKSAFARLRMRSILNTIESVERGEYREPCEGCGKPLLDGQWVVYYDDAGSIHADCDFPERSSGGPGAHQYESGFTPDECAAEIAKCKALLDQDT